MNEEDHKQEVVIKHEIDAIGIASFILGILGLFALTIVLSPLALILGIVGLFKKQILWSILGIILSFLGMFTSGTFLLIFFSLIGNQH